MAHGVRGLCCRTLNTRVKLGLLILVLVGGRIRCESISEILKPTMITRFVPLIRLPVTLRYRDHIGWNRPTSKIISRLTSLRYLLGLTPTSAIGPMVQREHSRIRTE